MDHRTLLALAINRLPGHSGIPKRHVFDLCRDLNDLGAAIDAYFRSSNRRSRCPEPSASSLLKTAEIELQRMNQHSIAFRILGDVNYPTVLSEISDPPFVLYHRGNLNATTHPAIAIVGTRKPSLNASREAYRLGLEFSMAGYPVVSGLAFGIDRAVHEGALGGTGFTWAVLAGGLDRPSPFSHRRLASKILDQGGLLLGEMPPECYPERYAFPRRNRILSGLCRGCIVVQAPARSGALITADFALNQGRDLYIARAGMDGAASQGTQTLESQGAPVIQQASDVLADWGRFPVAPAYKAISPPESPESLAQLMKKELTGRVFRYMGGWFEYSRA